MTGAEIIKALECCITKQHENCCNLGKWSEQWNCMTDLMGKALALIKRQREEIAKLEAENAEQDQAIINAFRYIKVVREEARAEAIREFAERIKEQSYESIDWSHGVHPLVCEFGIVEEIAEEMTEEQK